jgi:hypothetical protein
VGRSRLQGAVRAAKGRKGLMAVLEVAHPQAKQPATIFYLFGYFMPYAYAITMRNFLAESQFFVTGLHFRVQEV